LFTVFEVSSELQLTVFVKRLNKTVSFSVFRISSQFQLTLFVERLKKTVLFPVFEVCFELPLTALIKTHSNTREGFIGIDLILEAISLKEFFSRTSRTSA